MKKTVLLAISAVMILSSCQQDDINETSSSDDLVSFTFHYHGESYKLEFLDEGENLTLISEIPEALKNLGELPELATVVIDDSYYFFDNEREKFEYYGHDYSLLVSSREEPLIDEESDVAVGKNGPLINKSSSSNCCNHYADFKQMANMYLDSYWGGARMNLSYISQLKNLKNANFNDKISSMRVDPPFFNPLNISGFYYGAPNTRRLIAYEHANFGGRSYELAGNKFYGGIIYVGHRRLKSQVFGFLGTKNWNDRISSFDILFNNSSVIPSGGSGSGGSGGGGTGGGPGDDLPIL